LGCCWSSTYDNKELSNVLPKASNCCTIFKAFPIREFNISRTCKSRPLSTSIHEQVNSAIQVQTNKRLARKKTKKLGEGVKDRWNVVAYAAGEELALDELQKGLQQQGLYQSVVLPDDAEDVLHVLAKYEVGTEPREVYIFREGSVVFWNISELERDAILKFLKKYAHKPYDELLVHDENEIMEYSYNTDASRLIRGRIILGKESDLEKYTVSNALSLAVKLAIWENTLAQFVESIEDITEDLKSGRPIRLSRDQVLRKMGELFALRHFINLSSDLLDTPDFYWERENLEPLYQKMCSYLNMSKRTRVMNEKMNHCSELMQLLKDHLNDQHHVRLEVMIIVLIMIEVVFECIHWVV